MHDMRVLVVAREKDGALSPFVTEQVASLRELGVRIHTMGITTGGLRGYMGGIRRLRHAVRHNCYDIVHAHYGLSGLFVTLQRTVPTVITFHGSDINQPRIRQLSRIAANRAAATIVVSRRLAELSGFRRPPSVIPCGVDPRQFYPEEYTAARRALAYGGEGVVLFGSSRQRVVKNFPLAEAAVRSLGGDVRLVELDGLSRADVRRMLSAADVLLLTSHSEGSPQIVKEAILTGCPVVSTDVGDARDVLSGVPYCHVVESTREAVAAALQTVLSERKRVPSGQHVLTYTMASTARRLIELYTQLLHGVADSESTNMEKSPVRETSLTT